MSFKFVVKVFVGRRVWG